MFNEHFGQIAAEFGYSPRQVRATAELLDDGATVPFISRYRKERTGSLDEVAIAAIRDRMRQLRQLNERRQAILASLQERELLTEELQDAIHNAKALPELEDIYLPYRPKLRTRAMIAAALHEANIITASRRLPAHLNFLTYIAHLSLILH